MWETACVITLCISPWPGGEHLCYTLSISTSLAPILVWCELVRKIPAVPFGDTFQDTWIASCWNSNAESSFSRPSGVSIGFLLGDFLSFMPIVQRHAAIHTLTHGDPNSVFVSLDDFIKSGGGREVSVCPCLEEKRILQEISKHYILRAKPNLHTR